MLHIVFWILHSEFNCPVNSAEGVCVQICSFLSSCLLLTVLKLWIKALPSIQFMR